MKWSKNQEEFSTVTFPLTTAEALSLAKHLGYCPKIPALQAWFSKGLLERPEQRDGHHYQWTVEDLVRLLNHCEKNRVIDLFHPTNRNRLTQDERIRAAQDRASNAAAVSYWALADPASVLSTLVQEPSTKRRALIAAGLLERLETLTE